MAQSVEQDLKEWLIDTLALEGDSAVRMSLEHPADMNHGDFATNIALVEAKKRAKNPRDLAAEFAVTLEGKKLDIISKIETAGPGFINIFLKPEYFAGTIAGIAENAGFGNSASNFGANTDLAGQKIIIEYTNCNVLKPMHIGHLMGNIIGESISRIIEWNGAEIKRDTYQGDSGLHIAKVVWGIMKSGGIQSGSVTENLSKKVEYIGSAYALGATAYEDDEQAQQEIKQINDAIFNKTDQDLLKIYEWGREISLAQFEELYKKLGTKFDYYFFESEIADEALVIVKKFLDTGLFEKSDGAIIFRGEKYDPKLHTRVFVSNQGLPMYEAKDIAHALRKENVYSADLSLILTANEQNEYFRVVLRALQEIDPVVAQKTKHISHGVLKLATGKMSSRTGDVITAESLIRDVEMRVTEKIADRDMSESEKTDVAQIVAIGALKYSILRQAIGGDIIFDFEKSLSFEGDSGPYAQYAYVRTQSILAKVTEKAHEKKTDLKMPSNWQTTTVEKLLDRFPEVIEHAGREYAPHHIVTYVTELASAFNAFYAHEKILDTADPQSPYKIAVTQAVGTVLKNGLNVLGIDVPDRM